MNDSVSIQYRDNMSFNIEVNGHKMVVDKIKMAISLSQEKYCGVSYSYRIAM